VIVKAIRDYLDSGLPQQALDLSTTAKDAFMESLMSVVPSELSVIHHAGPAGTDVLDAAVKLAKYATGRRHVLSFHGGYHGHGHGPLAMMGNLGAKSKVPGTMADVHFLPFPYQYRNPFGIAGKAGEDAVLDYIETILRDDEGGIPRPACLVMEAIQGEGGVNPMSPAALQRIRKLTEDLGIVLIMDEVQAGVCRSGDFWAFQESGIVPDVLCMSKSLGGSMPMAVMAYRRELDVWHPGAHTGTFRGNQIAFACGRASLEYMKEVKLWEQVRRKGEGLKRKLNELKDANEVCIGDVRGRGLMLGVEYVHPRNKDHLGNSVPFSELAAEVQTQCLRRGLIIERGGRGGAVLRFLVPLIVEESELDIMYSIFADASRAAAKKILKK
jgi:diaminobutyrate-2-oxoglutarate transaminase